VTRAEQIADLILEGRRNLKADLERALNHLRRRNPTGYAQMVTTPFWPWPAYVQDDPNDPWWYSDEAASRLQIFKEGALEGVKPATRRRTVPKQWPAAPEPDKFKYDE
jgi:hypothetical protein